MPKQVDVLHERESGQEFILEVNGTSSGLSPEVAEEDNQHIREVTMQKMNAELCSSPNLVHPRTEPGAAAAATMHASLEAEPEPELEVQS